jgi:methyl-accepting chemotaxis protein
MRYRRRKYIVSSGFQWRFVLGFVAVALAGSGAATVLFNLLAQRRLEELRWSAFVPVQSTGEVLKPLFMYVNLFSLIFVAVLLVITGALMLRRVSGPVYRISKDLKSIGEGNFSSGIILRRHDEFRDVAEALNEMLDRLRERFSESRAKYEQISQELLELELAHARGIPLEEKTEKILGMIHEMRQQISTTRLEENS